jgi:hypothetical protein
MNKLSTLYYEAILSGDKELAEKTKLEMNELSKSAQRVSRVSPVQINTVLGDDNTPAIQIYNFLNDRFKDEWWDWEIETLEKVLWRDYGTTLTDSMAEKIQAIKLVLNSQRTFLDWWYFNQVANSMMGSPADFTTIKSPSSGMAIAAMRVMRQIRPEENFSRDVKKYVCIILKNDGIYVPPPSVPELVEEMENIVSNKEIWPKVLERLGQIINKEDLGDSDNTIDIQARRLLVAEKAADKFGG